MRPLLIFALTSCLTSLLCFTLAWLKAVVAVERLDDRG